MSADMTSALANIGHARAVEDVRRDYEALKAAKLPPPQTESQMLQLLGLSLAAEKAIRGAK